MTEPDLNRKSRLRGNLALLRFGDRLTSASAFAGTLAVIALLILLLTIMGIGAAPAVRTFGSSFVTESHWVANPPPQRVAYTSKPGDTLEKIAQQYYHSATSLEAKQFMTDNSDVAVNPTAPIDAGSVLVVVLPPPPPTFGALAFIMGTLVSAGIALFIALPISLGSAIFLTKLGPRHRIRSPEKRTLARNIFAVAISLLLTVFWMGMAAEVDTPSIVRFGLLLVSLPLGFYLGRLFFDRFLLVIGFMIELLAAIPSIAYGLWGVAVLKPFNQLFLQKFICATADINVLGSFLPHWSIGLNMGHWPLIAPYFQDSGYGSNTFTAGLILAIMVTPIMTAIIRDVLAVAPPELEQGALGLGATWWQATKLVLGFSKMGILGAVILGFARAIGETMAVSLVIGDQVSFYSDGPMQGRLDRSLFAPADSIASKLAVQFANADTNAEIHALIFMAFVLLLITTIINSIARVMIMRVSSRGLKPRTGRPVLKIMTLGLVG